MGDIRTDLEQGIPQEFTDETNDVQDVQRYENNAVLSKEERLKQLYYDEVARHKAEQMIPEQKAWEVLENAAAKKRAQTHQEEDRQAKILTLSDKLHRQGLLVQARLEGIKDLDKFQELADFFESSNFNYEFKNTPVPSGLSEEEKMKIIAHWQANGWDCNLNNFYESGGDEASLSLNRRLPFRLSRENIKLIKGLISSDNDPVGMVKDLRKLGFWFNEHTLKSSVMMERLSKLFTAPHAEEVLKLAQIISKWSDDWFTGESRYSRGSNKSIETGIIDLLTQYAQNPDPKAVFQPEVLKKIDTLSLALNVNVGASEISQLQNILNNPDYLCFAAYLTQLEFSESTREIPVYDNFKALDNAGVLKTILDLYRLGISVDAYEKYAYSHDDPSLRKLFTHYETERDPEKVQKEVIEHLQNLFSLPDLQAIIQDPQKQEFTGLLADFRGRPLAFHELTSINNFFGEDIEHAKEVVYILKLLNSLSIDAVYDLDFETLAGLSSKGHLMDTFTDNEFVKFLQTLNGKTGYIPSRYDLFYNNSSRLAEVFNNMSAREGLVRDTTAEVIKVIHPHGGLNLYRPDYYIRLGANPNIVRTISVLRSIGCEFDSTSLPSAESLEEIANSPSAMTILESDDLKKLVARLVQEFKWDVRTMDAMNLVKLYDDKELQNALFDTENANYIKRINPYGLNIADIKSMLDLDPIRRDLIIDLIYQFSYYPDFSSFRKKEQEELLTKLVEDNEFRAKLFSDPTRDVFNKIKSNYGYYRLNVKDIDTIIDAPGDFPDYIAELKNKYNYTYDSKDLMSLLELAANKDQFNSLLDTLVSYGYTFQINDRQTIAQLLPLAGKLPILLDTINNLVSEVKTSSEDAAEVTKKYTFKLGHVSHLIEFEAIIDRLPDTLDVLGAVMGYKFDVIHSQELVQIVRAGYSREQLVQLKQTYEKYISDSSNEFNIHTIQSAAFIAENEETINRLESYNYKFSLKDIQNLTTLLAAEDREELFRVLDILRDELTFVYDPVLSEYYKKLAQIPNIEEKLKEASTSIAKEELMIEQNFKLFVAIQADASQYNHVKKLFSDDYFVNIRDAQNRITKFRNLMLSGKISNEALSKIFAVSSKATELDRIAFRYGIDMEIAKAENELDWHTTFLESTNFQEADATLVRIMTDLAIPVIYSDLEGKDLEAKKNELIDLAGKDNDFDDIIELTCRSVGVYGQKYPSRGNDFEILMNAIRLSLELNLERNPAAYLKKRAQISEHQFNSVFEGMPDTVREKIMKTWLDLSARRRLRVSGDIITSEEATLSRLNRIKDIVQSDLSVHIKELFKERITELEKVVVNGDTNNTGAEQLAIYKKFLLTPEGSIREDIPMVYRSLNTIIREAKAALKDPNILKEMKGKLGKSVGTYTAIADSLKALFRLGTVSEERFKARQDYLNEIENHIGEFSASLKRLKILDPERRSQDTNIRALEEEVLLDFTKLKDTMTEENVSGQTSFETESTVALRNLARAPEMTQSCQRLTEQTGYNHAAYSRLLDGNNEMIDIIEKRNGERYRLARSFIELSKVKITGEASARPVVLIDREYVNPQYQYYEYHFSQEMIMHMLDRLVETPELAIIVSSGRFDIDSDVQEKLQARGYQLKEISGEYFVNESNVRLAKYYDSLYGLTDVSQSSWKMFNNFFIIEKT